ncbi:Cobyric acid synthase [[Clostridium] ultunense Esp]|nr:Cobyric acid synthase [[Clostridium] ultunense Esp]
MNERQVRSGSEVAFRCDIEKIKPNGRMEVYGMSKNLMVVGTASNVGKSILVTALCRIFAQDGFRVAPFKAQNMSLNSAATPSGREIGRAQAAQAEAAGVLANEHMNPVLLKPMHGMRTQIILQGRLYEAVTARDYFHNQKQALWEAVVDSFRFLSERYEIIVMEGAGSPVEMNLKPYEIANMRAAEMADAAVILVADIERGGVFASVVGTLHLLEPYERARVRGIVINKFRGDPALFDDGVRWLEKFTGIPILGVLPYIENLGIDEEDSMGLESTRYKNLKMEKHRQQELVQIAIVQLPHMANFTDFDPLFLEEGVHVYFCEKPQEIKQAHAVILPGTKNTMVDLLWLKENGWVTPLLDARREGKLMVGICGGYQMLGQKILDPDHRESEISEMDGLGFFDTITKICAEKRTVLVEGTLLGKYEGLDVAGYEIHMGITEYGSESQPFAHVKEWNEKKLRAEGNLSRDGLVIGTYLHGILHNDRFRNALLSEIRERHRLPPQASTGSMAQIRADSYDRLAEIVRQHLDVRKIYHMLGVRTD